MLKEKRFLLMAAIGLIGLVAVLSIVSIPDVYAQPMQSSTICAASFFAPLIAQVTPPPPP